MKEQRQRPEFFIALSKDVGTAVYLRKEAAGYFDHLEAELLHARKEIEELRERENRIKLWNDRAEQTMRGESYRERCIMEIKAILLEGKQ